MENKLHKVIEKIYRENLVWKLLNKSARLNLMPYDLRRAVKEDIEQDIYLYLLKSKKPEDIIKAYNKGQIEYYIRHIINKQVNSTTSSTAIKYFRWNESRKHILNEDCILNEDTMNKEAVQKMYAVV